jgi:hypothetical protein
MTGMYASTDRLAVAGTGVARVRSAVCAMPTNGSWHLASILFATHDPKPGPGGSP